MENNFKKLNYSAEPPAGLEEKVGEILSGYRFVGNVVDIYVTRFFNLFVDFTGNPPDSEELDSGESELE